MLWHILYNQRAGARTPQLLLLFVVWLLLVNKLTVFALAESIIHQRVSDWLSGRLRGVAVTQEGILLPGMVTETTAELEEEGVQVIWSAVDDGNGGVILGTGPEGLVLHVKNTGEVTQLADLEEPHVFSLVIDEDGVVWAAASPGGALYKIREAEKPIKWWEGQVEYIWKILLEGRSLVLATGCPAMLVRVTNQNEATVLCRIPDNHVRSMARGGNNEYFLGTSGRGILLLWDGNDLEPLATSNREEIRQIEVVDKDSLIFLCIGDRDTEKSNSSANRNTIPEVNTTAGISGGSSLQKTTAQEAFALLGFEGNPTDPLLRNEISGELWIWTKKEGASKCVSLVGQPQAFYASKQEVWIGTGPKGHLFSVDTKRRKVSVMAQSTSKFLTGFLQISDALYITGSFPAAIYRLRKADQPIYESPVIDAGAPARWGKVNPLGETLSIQQRFGWTPEPDSLWTKWFDMNLQADRLQQREARFMQYRIVPAPTGVRRTEIYFTRINNPPVIKDLCILTTGEKFVIVENPPAYPGQLTLEQLVQNERQTRAQPAVNSVTGQNDVSEQHRVMNSIRVASQGGKGFRSLVIMAEDPDGDELEFAIEYRKAGQQEFLPLVDRLQNPFFNLDTSGWEEGWYEFRVSVRDIPPVGKQSFSSQETSMPFLVDNTAPEVELMKTVNNEITFRVKDKLTEVSTVEVSENGIDYRRVLPKDGVLDSKEELFSYKTSQNRIQGIFVRAADANGNITGKFLSTQTK